MHWFKESINQTNKKQTLKTNKQKKTTCGDQPNVRYSCPCGDTVPLSYIFLQFLNCPFLIQIIIKWAVFFFTSSGFSEPVSMLFPNSLAVWNENRALSLSWLCTTLVGWVQFCSDKTTKLKIKAKIKPFTGSQDK